MIELTFSNFSIYMYTQSSRGDLFRNRHQSDTTDEVISNKSTQNLENGNLPASGLDKVLVQHFCMVIILPLIESREVCEKNNASLPWKTFSIESANIRGAGSEASSYIKSRVFWLSTTIEHPVNMTSLTSEIGGPISSVLKDLEHQIAGLLINSHPNKNATYCAIRFKKPQNLHFVFFWQNSLLDSFLPFLQSRSFQNSAVEVYLCERHFR